MKKVLILEDNPATLEYLKSIVQEMDSGNMVWAFDNVRDAYHCAMERTIDLFLVDIILDTKLQGDASGLKFVESIRQVGHYSFTPVIFVTSLEDSRGYTYEKLHCYSFIEKPFNKDKVKQVVAQGLSFPGHNNNAKTLFFRKEGIVLAVNVEDIVYAESIDRIMHIHTKQEDILTIPYITINKLLEETDSEDMIQCSRNTIVNKKFIFSVDLTNRIIRLKDDFGNVEIGVRFKKYMKECFD